MRLNARMLIRLSIFLVVALAASSCTAVHVLYLAHDDREGRVPGTAGHVEAQDWIINYLTQHGVEATDGTTNAVSFRQTYNTGTNIVGQIPGTDLASEIVMVGAHYDHVANCDNQGGSSVCNGATDNAAGTAIALEIAADIFDNGPAPRRTVMFGFWDQEESGLIGSQQWIANNPGVAANIVAYVNYDIQGANLLPSLRNSTLAVGAESGGAFYQAAVATAGDASTLDLSLLSVIFGQGRSDHANFVAAGVPSVFFTDATGPCYHTTADAIDVLDVAKLTEQQVIGNTLVADLAAGTTTPAFNGGAALATYDDAVVIHDLVAQGLADLARFTPAQQAALTTIEANVAAIVAAGAGGFTNAAQSTLLLSSLDLVTILASGSCDGFLIPPSTTTTTTTTTLP
ncbi:MAG: Zn-dependent M28 family amino/carboxypeptidase [Candidatus Aldehydirespiratoraceae bacterium]|jgi:Zn-dependent M28 family amino/carboxypeptidase